MAKKSAEPQEKKLTWSEVIASIDLSETEGMRQRRVVCESAIPMYRTLKRIIEDLPTNRDWLDPDIERAAKDILDRIEGRQS